MNHQTKNMDSQTSTEYIQRCVETIKADKNLSEHTITLMFMEYAKILHWEKRKAINDKVKAKK